MAWVAPSGRDSDEFKRDLVPSEKAEVMRQGIGVPYAQVNLRLHS